MKYLITAKRWGSDSGTEIVYQGEDLESACEAYTRSDYQDAKMYNLV